jgi:hypothetical protein
MHAQPHESISMSIKVLPFTTMTTRKIPRKNNKGKDEKTPLQGGRTICARSVEKEQPSLQNHLNPMPNKIKTHHHTLLPDTEDRSATTPMPNKRESTEKRLFKGTSAIGCGGTVLQRAKNGEARAKRYSFCARNNGKFANILHSRSVRRPS